MNPETQKLREKIQDALRNARLGLDVDQDRALLEALSADISTQLASLEWPKQKAGAR
jgi:hypothetical protein